MRSSPLPHQSPFSFGLAALPPAAGHGHGHKAHCKPMISPYCNLQGLRIISLFLSSSPTDASLHWHSRGVREARGSWGLGWCLWDARHLGCWETWAPSLISSRFSFYPAVWHWGLLSLIETRVCGKSRVYASADQPRVVKAARACSWRLQELASLDKWLHLDGQAEMSC